MARRAARDLVRERPLVDFVKLVSGIAKGKAYSTSTVTLGKYTLIGLHAEEDQASG